MGPVRSLRAQVPRRVAPRRGVNAPMSLEGRVCLRRVGQVAKLVVIDRNPEPLADPFELAALAVALLGRGVGAPHLNHEIVVEQPEAVEQLARRVAGGRRRRDREARTDAAQRAEEQWNLLEELEHA